MIDKCEKCSVSIHWNNTASPPAQSNRAKEGKIGWFVEAGGELHTLDRCKKQPTLFVAPTVTSNHTMDEAEQVVLMAMSKANKIVDTLYAGIDNDNLKGQIRSRITDQLLSVYNAKIQ